MDSSEYSELAMLSVVAVLFSSTIMLAPSYILYILSQQHTIRISVGSNRLALNERCSASLALSTRSRASNLIVAILKLTSLALGCSNSMGIAWGDGATGSRGRSRAAVDRACALDVGSTEEIVEIGTGGAEGVGAARSAVGGAATNPRSAVRSGRRTNGWGSTSTSTEDLLFERTHNVGYRALGHAEDGRYLAVVDLCDGKRPALKMGGRWSRKAYIWRRAERLERSRHELGIAFGEGGHFVRVS
jgi:hypothetical protein